MLHKFHIGTLLHEYLYLQVQFYFSLQWPPLSGSPKPHTMLEFYFVLTLGHTWHLFLPFLIHSSTGSFILFAFVFYYHVTGGHGLCSLKQHIFWCPSFHGSRDWGQLKICKSSQEPNEYQLACILIWRVWWWTTHFKDCWVVRFWILHLGSGQQR